jgi:DNA topoisomerase-1
MEESLDEIAEGKKEWIPVLRNFYEPFEKTLKQKQEQLGHLKREDIPTDELCELCEKPMVVKFGRFGKFLACTGFPECKNTKPLRQDGDAVEILTTEETCPACGAPMNVKQGRFGSFLGCSKYPACKTIKSLEKGTGVKCPKCQKGEIIPKRSKKGRTFYSCNQYPACDFALWKKPSGETCAKCQSLIVIGAKGVEECSNKNCGK